MDMMGKKVIITGAFGAAGRALLRCLGRQGVRLGAIDATAKPDNHFADIWCPHVDLTDMAATKEAVVSCVRHMSGIDGLVNIAGGFKWETIIGGQDATWDHLYDINLRTALHATRAVLPHMSLGGSIVNVGAAAAMKATVGMGPYTASKAAVAKLTEALADEVKDADIRVNLVQPSILDTEANRRDMPDGDFARWVAPEALADVICFLLSDQSRAVTGASILVNGRM